LNETSLKWLWNAGTMEYWNTGYQNDQNISLKIDIFRSKTHYSKIPKFHYSSEVE